MFWWCNLARTDAQASLHQRAPASRRTRIFTSRGAGTFQSQAKWASAALESASAAMESIAAENMALELGDGILQRCVALFVLFCLIVWLIMN